MSPLMRDDTPSPERDEARSAAGHALATGDEAAPSDAGADPLAAILAGRGSHRRKFGTAYAVLGVLAAVAIVAFVALLIRGGPADARPWSTFEPAGQEIAAA